MKKIVYSLFAVLIVLAVLVYAFQLRYKKMTLTFREGYKQVQAIDLTQIPDGAYQGSFGDFLASVKLEVTVKNHVITDIKVLEQHSGPGYEALDTIARIVKIQSPKVDVVTGATGSSMGIQISVYQALNTAVKK